MPSKEELTERAQLVRELEAMCHIPYPTADELNFRLALMKRLGQLHGLSQVRALVIEGPNRGPARTITPPPAPATRPPGRPRP